MASGRKIIFISLIFLLIAYIVSAQELDEIESQIESQIEDIFLIDFSPQSDAAFQMDSASRDDRLFPTFSYGAAAAWLTRIINQTERSNFVFRDFLPGLYFCAEMRNLPYIVPSLRLAAYYPLISTFNHVPQPSNTPLHYALDLFACARMEMEWKIITVSAGPGLHMFFLNSDRWNYLNLGLGAAAGIEIAINPKWSLLFDGFASLDNGNLGGNKQMEPFDITWQYQLGFGMRYSKVKNNDSALFLPDIDSSRLNR